MIKKLLLVLLSLFLFITFELLSRLIIPDKKLNTLESIFKIIEEDAVLFWRQRAHLDTEFQGVKVTTNSLGLRNKEISLFKSKDTFRVICLGASPTFGWGVSVDNAYPFLLEQKLKKNKQQFKDIEVINAGQIGYSSHQGLIFFEQYLMKYSPDLAVVSYVLNDIDRYKFFRNEGLRDKELKQNRLSAIIIGLKKTFASSRLYLVLKRGATGLIYKNKRLAALALKKQVDLASVRVSGDDYKVNLEKFLNLCAQNGVKIIFVKMPIHLSLPQELEDIQAKAGRTSGISSFYYNLGVDYEMKKDYQKAFNSFQKAKDYLVLECYRDGKIYQGLMQDVSLQNNIPLVDAAYTFAQAGRDKELFNGKADPTHPNCLGHKLIADALYTEILENNLLKN